MLDHRVCANCLEELGEDLECCSHCGRPKTITDLGYLNNIEILAHKVIESAYENDIQIDLARIETVNTNSFLLSIETLARALRHYHFSLDDCESEE